MKDYEADKCAEDEDDEWCLGIKEGRMSGPDPVSYSVNFLTMQHFFLGPYHALQERQSDTKKHSQ